MSQDATAAQTVVSVEAFLRTYSPPHDLDPVVLAEQYQRVLDFAAAKPHLGGSAIARRLEIPRSRVRGWIDRQNPSTPDCVRGLRRAESAGWVSVAHDSETFRGLNILVASVFSGGSIATDTYRPLFTIDGEADRARLDRAFAHIDVDYDITRAHDDARATELTPAEHAPILGRVLVAMGSPKGAKARSATALPDYLDVVDDAHRLTFARTYLTNRGNHFTDKDTITLREERSERYLEDLTGFLETVSGESVRRNGKNVVVSAAAARALDVSA